MTKNTSQIQIPSWLDTRGDCANCMTPTHLNVATAKGHYYLCSNQCQDNFKLKAGLKGYNQVRDHSPLVLTTLGKLDELTAAEIERVYKFKNQLTRSNMNRQKEGDSLDKVLGMIDTRSKKKRSKVQTKMPFILTTPENEAN